MRVRGSHGFDFHPLAAAQPLFCARPVLGAGDPSPVSKTGKPLPTLLTAPGRETGGEVTTLFKELRDE